MFENLRIFELKKARKKLEVERLEIEKLESSKSSKSLKKLETLEKLEKLKKGLKIKNFQKLKV